MISRAVLNIRPTLRKFATSAIRCDDHDTSGIPGSNLPFSIKNRYLLTLGFIGFFGVGFGMPFLMIRNMILKQN